MGLKLDSQGAIGIELSKNRGKPGAGTYNADFSKTVKFNGSYTMKGK